MPHQIVEYSSNLESQVDIAEMIRLLHETVASIDAFPRAALRTRVARRKQYCIADHDPANAFVHVLLRIASGRSPEVKKAAGDQIFQVLCEYLAPVQEVTPLGISFEIQEIDPVFRWKRNNLPAWLEKRAAARTVPDNPDPSKP